MSYIRCFFETDRKTVFILSKINFFFFKANSKTYENSLEHKISLSRDMQQINKDILIRTSECLTFFFFFFTKRILRGCLFQTYGYSNITLFESKLLNWWFTSLFNENWMYSSLGSWKKYRRLSQNLINTK